ncbi:MAG: transcriptional repressor [Eubacterium sp.]|nr:transcriptional repressor [Eubacterium sp.]
MKTREITDLFKEKGIKATQQRIAVYKFLEENHIHPDVETVYKHMVKEHPSFSKTTVYNCLQALSACGLLIPVKIDNEKIRYDADTSFHGHFICEVCKGIYDFKCAEEKVSGLDNFEIRQKDVYYSGICSCCKNKN